LSCLTTEFPDTGVPAGVERFNFISAKGRQYVSVASGNGGGSIPLTGPSTIVIFGL
jgi:hypothetical protein